MILLSSFAPHITEELWFALGNCESISKAKFPKYEEKYLVESAYEYPVSFNGKMRFKIELPLDMPKDEVEKTVLADERTAKWIDGKTVRKFIFVPKKIINVAIG